MDLKPVFLCMSEEQKKKKGRETTTWKEKRDKKGELSTFSPNILVSVIALVSPSAAQVQPEAHGEKATLERCHCPQLLTQVQKRCAVDLSRGFYEVLTGPVLAADQR